MRVGGGGGGCGLLKMFIYFFSHLSTKQCDALPFSNTCPNFANKTWRRNNSNQTGKLLGKSSNCSGKLGNLDQSTITQTIMAKNKQKTS